MLANKNDILQDVFMNLHKEHGKPLVQRVIDQLVAEQKLSEKVNGKQKCFVINQGSVFKLYAVVYGGQANNKLDKQE